MARGNELTKSQKELIVELWKDGERYRKMSDDLNILFTTISSFIAMYKKLKTVENKRITGALRKIQES